MVTVRYAHNIDLSHNSLINAHVQGVSGLPAAPPEMTGWLLANTMNGRLYYCNGTAWQLHATNSDALGGQNSAYHLDRANHSGTQPASTISGLDTAIAATPLNNFAAPTGPVAMGNQRITGGAPGVALTDYATVGQVTDIANNLGFKLVRVASTTNVLLSSGVGTVIDGVTLANGDRVLLKNQTTASQNGIYTAGAGALTRATDADSAAEMPGGTIVVVDQGTAGGDKMFILATNSPYVLGTDALTFAPYGNAPNPYTAGNGINITGQTISAVASTGIVVGAGGIAVDTTSVSRYREFDLPAPSSGTSVTYTHGLNRRPLPVTVMDKATGDKVYPGINWPDANSVLLDFTVAPVAGQYRVSVG